MKAIAATVLFVWFGLPLIAQSPARLASSMPPGEIAQALRQQSPASDFNYKTQLRAAFLAFDRQDFQSAQDKLLTLAKTSFLNGEAIELLYRSHQALGDKLAAEMVLAEGLAAYPHSIRLLRMQALERMEKGEFNLREQVLATTYPEALRYEISALLAFRQNDLVYGLLDAERASYGYTQQVSLGPELQSAVASAYSQLLQADSTELASWPLSYRDTSFRYAYATALVRAAGLINGRQFKSLRADGLTQLEILAKLRSSCLRYFARPGQLAKWPDPLLVDLYVLDRAGHLEIATALSLSWMLPEDMIHLEQSKPGSFLRARTYMSDQWSDDVDKMLGAVDAHH